MPGVTREQVAAAVFALVDTAVGAVVGLKTSSRRFRIWTQVDPAQMPALFQLQGAEEYERTAGKLIGLPPKRTMHFEIWLYVVDAQEDTVTPSQQLNAMIDAVEAAFAPDATTGAMTLGGLAVSARIDGHLDYGENLTGDGKSIAVIPVVVIRP
jgi:hypothetical protein